MAGGELRNSSDTERRSADGEGEVQRLETPVVGWESGLYDS